MLMFLYALTQSLLYFKLLKGLLWFCNNRRETNIITHPYAITQLFSGHFYLSLCTFSKKEFQSIDLLNKTSDIRKEINNRVLKFICT